jgi:hypothetical protein
MIKQVLVAATVTALLAAAPSWAQDGRTAASGMVALGLTAALLRSHPPPVVYPVPAVIYPAAPVIAAPHAGGEPALPDLHP